MYCKRCEALPHAGGCLRHPCESCRNAFLDRSLRLCQTCSHRLGECQCCRRKVHRHTRSQNKDVKIVPAKKKQPSPQQGSTCAACAKLPLPANCAAGSCAHCAAFTASRAIALCDSCSGKLSRCNRCQRPLTATRPSRLRPPRK